MFHHVFRLIKPGGGYAYFGEAHRLPAFFYLQFSFLWLVLAALASLAILVILLPALHRKSATFLLGTTAIISGTVAGYGLIMPEWQTGFLTLPTAESVLYRPENMPILNSTFQPSVFIGLRIGLSGANFTLSHAAHENHTFYWDERIEFDSLLGMKSQFKNSLRRGLPVALLELQEQVAGCGDIGESGFMWPFHLREAGYYCSWLLCASLTTWAISCLLLITVPRTGAWLLGITGILIVMTAIIYTFLVPQRVGPSGVLRVSGEKMSLNYGSCLWVAITVGLYTAGVGFYLYIYHHQHPHKFYTDLDVDYDELENENRKSEVTSPEAAKQDEEQGQSSSYEETRL